MDAWLEQRDLGGATVQYRLRDWNMSRQRFWGTPIPMVHCAACAKQETQRGAMAGWHAVPERELPVCLPELADYSDLTASPLANDHAWQRAKCPQCGGPARRETDTMTTFMDSAWYFLRFCDPQDEHAIFDPALVQTWMPVDYYVGGREHAVGHLLYSRFVTHVLCRAGLLKLTRPAHEDALPEAAGEPFRRLYNQGIVYKDGAKMSKSKGNVVSADDLAEQYGADTARLFSFFGGPYDVDIEWTVSGVEGCHRFLRRVWRLAYRVAQAQHGRGEQFGQHDKTVQAVVRARHRAVAGVSADIHAWRFNTAIAKLMEYLNELEELWQQDDGIDDGGAFRAALQVMAQLLCPFAPHIAEELWQGLGGGGLCGDSRWPEHDPALLVEAMTEYPVQVNGKLRGHVRLPREAGAEAVLAAAKTDPAIVKWLAGKELLKEIVIPRRMVTFVVK
jgi:leucyl-tRNA synthetase